ncbi:hypothetical protein AHAS_Ahas19G0228300 [Arachis hypogaea]
MKCIHLTELYHFHDMIDMLVGCGYKKGTTFLGYGYDFRQNNSVGRIDKLMDGLKAKLETAYKASGGRKVNLISHSMGGIMILCFLSLHRDDFVKYVNKWTCLTCPFQGDLPVVISCASLALADAGIMSVDYTDFNKVCPKDPYPLPSIDALVDSTSGATYQRLMNKVFSSHLEKLIEVYVDDMLVKIRDDLALLTDLSEVFSTIGKHGMRLNPYKMHLCSGVREVLRLHAHSKKY